MSTVELLNSPNSRVELQKTESGYEVQTPSYVAHFHDDIPYIDLLDAKGTHWAALFKGSEIQTSESDDATYAFTSTHERRADGSIAFYIESESENDGHKIQTWICHEEFIETFVSMNIEGALRRVCLLGGTHVEPNMFGTSMSERHFQSVFNPQPSELERPAISALESTSITTSGMWKPGRRREFLMTPFSYGFSMSKPKQNHDLPDGTWLMASISAPISKQTFVSYDYDAREDGFSLELTYDSVASEASRITTPSLLFHFAENPYQGLEDAMSHATHLKHLDPLTAPELPAWHKSPTFVTWGHQLEQERRAHKEGVSRNAKDFMTESVTRAALNEFEARQIPIGKIVLDDKWQLQYGTNTPDLEKWPDMARFTADQHELGRRVLLWVKLFDPEGLPPELCILDAKGRPISSDPTNPEYIELIRDQVNTMLSLNGLDADGLKLDFLAQLPHGPGLRWHGAARGHAALHTLMQSIFGASQAAKRDSLIEAQVVSPWFADTMNQIRLNDTNERHSVTATMGARARLASTLLPQYPIDPDGWPMPDMKSWAAYIQAQPELTGTTTTHFITTVNGEPISEAGYEALRYYRNIQP